MTPRERVLTALALKQPDRVPFADYIDDDFKETLVGHPVVNEADFAKEIGMDAIYFTEYMTPVFCKDEHGNVPEFGLQSGSDGGGVHFLGEGLIKTDDDLDKIQLPNPNRDAFYDPANRFVDRYGNDDLAIYAYIRPFGLFNIMFSMPMMDFSIALYHNRSLLEKMMDIFIEWNFIVIERLQQIGGIDFFMTPNDMAFKTGPFVSPVIFREFFLPRMQVVADTIKLPWAFHSDGDLNLVMDDLLTLGMNAINPIESPGMNLKEAKYNWGDKVCLWGNVDLHHALTLGTVEEVETEVTRCMNEGAPGGGYICASSNSITNYCKVENVRAMINAIQKYGTYTTSPNDL
jgi:uroporphyrinogen decarboxylase